MNTPLFQGERVRLVAPDLEQDAELIAGWSRDAEYARLLDSNPVMPWSAKWVKDDLAHIMETTPRSFVFMIQPLTGDRPIGFVALDGIGWANGDAWVAIGLGERAYWGKGYGTDAMRVLLRYAFSELNLHRVSLTVFEYNTRALGSYQKAGFVAEGRERQWLLRDGRRWDLIYMGVLREEWEQAVQRP